MTHGLIIACHAAPEWGFGHLHRSLALATVARKQGWKVHLVTRGPRTLIDKRVPLNLTACGVTREASRSSEFECMEGARDSLQTAGVERLRAVVDHPHVDVDYAERMATLAIPWMTYSQSANPPGPPDWAVSPLSAREQGAKERDSRIRWLGGPDFAVVRPIFGQGCPCPYRPLSENRRLLMTFGGGSDFRANERLLPPILEAFPELEIEVITTRSNDRLHRIEALVDQYGPGLRLTVEPDEIAVQMCEAGAAVTAGGTTTVELAALGIPFITVAIAENQEIPSKAWEGRGISFHAGQLGSETVVDDVLAHVNRLLVNPDECLQRSNRGRRCVDGRGAERILQHLSHEM